MIYRSDSAQFGSGMIGSLLKRIALRRLKRGLDLLRDLQVLLPQFRPDVIFDVGANVGESSKRYHSRFPNAEIFCFEPAIPAFRVLERRVGFYSNVHCFCIALGATTGRGMMTVQGSSPMNSLVTGKEPQMNAETLQPVEIDTVDLFCRRKGIRHIDFMKVDTEGQDFAILQGGKEMLNEGSIGLIQVEVGMNPTNLLHAPFDPIKRFMEGYHYFLFGLYDQSHEWLTGKPYLRRVDAVFISERLANSSD